jgi:transposase
VVEVEQWAEIRRMHFVLGVSIKEIARRTGRDRNTIRSALRSSKAPKYSRPSAGSKLDPFKDEIHRLLKTDAKLTGQRIRELIAPLGFDGGKTIVDDYLREVRPLFDLPRTFQRTIYRPGEICQFDLWEPKGEIAVGHGQTRKGWVVIGCLGYSRAGAGARVFSKQAEDLLFGIRRCLWSLGALPETLVWDRQAGLHAGDGRPTEAFAGFCGQLRVGWHFCDAGDPQAKGVVERLQDFAERSFEPGRVFANELDYLRRLRPKSGP